MIATPEKIEDIKKAITNRSLTNLEEIVENNPSLLNKTFADGEDLISLATKTYLSSTQNDDKTKSIRILRKILQEKFKGFPQQAEIDLETLFLNKVLLEQLYAEKNTDVDFEIFKKAILETLNKSSSNNSFNNIYKQIFESIKEAKEDNQKKPIKDAYNNSMFIYSFGLKNHQSYFIFHVDAQNKLTSISYCDGSSTEHSKIKGSSTHIQGVTTFALENSVKYSSEFAQKFINDNTKGKSIEDFHKKLETKEIQITEAKIDYKNTKYSIPTKSPKPENYTSKNTSILARFVAQKTNPQMTFELDSKTKKPKGDGHNEYKKFKENLIKEASKSTLELQEKTSKKSDNFSEYLKKEIEKTLDEVEKNNKRKLSSGQSLPSKLSLSLNLFFSQRLPNPRKIFHQELSGILSKRIKKEPEKTPPIEELTITQELQKKFPGFFPPEKQSRSFASFRSKELPSIKEKAKFIKTYHDLIAKKYKEIQSRKTKNDVKDEGLVAEGTKEQDLFKELKKLDEKIEELLVKDSRKLNDELYDLSPHHYPQATILGRNALASRKKSISIDIDGEKSKALSGEEYIKFLSLRNLIEVGKKIVEQKEPKNEDCNKTIEARMSVINIHRYLQFSSQDLEIFSDSYKRFQDSSESPNKNPLSLIREICNLIKENVNDDEKLQPQQNTELKKTRDTKENFNSYDNFLNLIEKEREREQTSILEELLKDYKNYKNKKEGKYNGNELIETLEQKYRNKLKEFKINFPTEDDISKVISFSTPKLRETETDLKIKFYNVCLADKNAEINNIGQHKEKTILIQEREKIRRKISDLEIKKSPQKYSVLSNLIADYKDYKNKKEDNYNGDELIETLEKKYRDQLKQFKKKFPTEKEQLQIITSYAPSINLNKNQLQLGFYNICVQDKLAEIKELEDKINTDNSNEDLQNSKKDAEKNCKELQNKIHFLKDKNLSTQSSLFLGLIPLKDLSKLFKDITAIADETTTLSRKFTSQMNIPGSNIISAFHKALEPTQGIIKKK